jgi:hypothetical protein
MAKRQLTPEALKVVRQYLSRVDRGPDLLFVAAAGDPAITANPRTQPCDETGSIGEADE